MNEKIDRIERKLAEIEKAIAEIHRMVAVRLDLPDSTARVAAEKRNEALDEWDE